MMLVPHSSYFLTYIPLLGLVLLNMVTELSALQAQLCPEDVRECPDNVTFISRDSDNNCEFKPCPDEMIVCPLDIMECPDGLTAVSRDPDNNCEFKPCPENMVVCAQDVVECPDGVTFMSRDPDINCEFKPCPDGVIVCAQDFEECPDGTFKSRDPDNNCEFQPCLEEASSSAFMRDGVIHNKIYTIITLTTIFVVWLIV